MTAFSVFDARVDTAEPSIHVKAVQISLGRPQQPSSMSLSFDSSASVTDSWYSSATPMNFSA